MPGLLRRSANRSSNTGGCTDDGERRQSESPSVCAKLLSRSRDFVVRLDRARDMVDTNDLQLNQGGWLTATGFSTHNAADVWSVATRALTATGLAAISTWTVDVTGSLSGNVGGIAGTIQTLDALDTAQDSQHGTTQTEVAKIPKTGDTNTYTQVSSDSGTKSAIVTIS